jgi:hypothetical protein
VWSSDVKKAAQKSGPRQQKPCKATKVIRQLAVAKAVNFKKREDAGETKDHLMGSNW